MRTLIGLGLALVSVVGCGERDNPKLEAAAGAIERSANACLLSLRDHHTKYKDTPDCNALGSLALGYLQAGGDKSGTPAKYDLRYMSAQRMAWTALAMSESCSGHPLQIW